MEDIQPLTIDDVSFTAIKPSVDCSELVLKELIPGADFFIFPIAAGSQTDGSGERIGAGAPKVYKAGLGQASYTKDQVLGFAQALVGAGTRTMVRISKT